MGQRKYCYAVHFIGGEDKIFFSWAECDKAMRGRPHIQKGFMCEDEAQEWLNSLTKEHEETSKQHYRWAKEAKQRKKELQNQIQSRNNVEQQRIQVQPNPKGVIRTSMITYQFRIDRKISDDLQKKLESMHITIDRLMDDLIRDYLY